MSKESRLEQARRDRQIAIDAADKEIESLLAEIEAEKEPVLRHGDYGISRIGFPGMVVRERHGGTLRTADSDYIFPNETVEENSFSPELLLGNIFDDLKAMQEDVTEFEMEATGHEATCGAVTVGDAINPRGLIFLSIERNDEIKSTHLTDEEFEIFTKKCQSKLATLKRRKK